MHITESRLLLDWKIFSLRVHPCIFQPGNFTGWGSEGVKQVMVQQCMRFNSNHVSSDDLGKKACAMFQTFLSK